MLAFIILAYYLLSKENLFLVTPEQRKGAKARTRQQQTKKKIQR